ncbi:MAG: ester cyclase [Pyrinomonadaceae bacterium]|nr:ester cyclase [Pyrinomonadaceae bacterium]
MRVLVRVHSSAKIAREISEKLPDGDRVTSRFVVSGNALGKEVRFNGITISRFSDGMIVEDWSVTDAMSMLRQIGVWRALLLVFSQWKPIVINSFEQDQLHRQPIDHKKPPTPRQLNPPDSWYHAPV